MFHAVAEDTELSLGSETRRGWRVFHAGFIPHALIQWVRGAAATKRTSLHICHLGGHLGAGLNLFLPSTIRGLW